MPLENMYKNNPKNVSRIKCARVNSLANEII